MIFSSTDDDFCHYEHYLLRSIKKKVTFAGKRMAVKNRVRLSKQFDFEAAHALDGYHGKCKDIHGHSYHLNVTIIGVPCEDKNDSTLGMVMDFTDLKKIVKENVIDQFDHWLILKSDSRFKGLDKNNERIRYVNYQPTCENMLLEIIERIQKKLPSHIALHNVFLRETARSYAEWFAEDQEG